MGKGPGSIYKDCLAQAKRGDKLVSSVSDYDNIQREINQKTGFCTLYEKDIRMAFFKQNYSEKTTNKAINQWGDLNLTQPFTYKGYRVFLFLESNSIIKKGAE